MGRLRLLLNQRGMTLIELLVTLSLVVVVTTLLAAILREGFISYDRTMNEADIQLTTRHQTDVLVEDIRSSKIAKLNETTYPIVSDNTKLTLYTGATGTPETISYFLHEHAIYRQINSETPKLVLPDANYFTVNQNEQMITIKIGIKPVTKHYQEELNKEIVLQARPRATLSQVSN